MKWTVEVYRRGGLPCRMLYAGPSETAAHNWLHAVTDTIVHTQGTGLVVLRKDRMAHQRAEYRQGECISWTGPVELARERGEEQGAA